MSRETWEILQQMEPKDVELQLALQCAPLIAGLKPSNLFNIPCEGVCQVRELIRDTGISMYVLNVILVCLVPYKRNVIW